MKLASSRGMPMENLKAAIRAATEKHSSYPERALLFSSR